MPTEIFRFMTIRPPQAAPARATGNVVDLSATRSDLLGALSREAKDGSRAAMERAAHDYVLNDPSFIDGRRKVDSKFLGFHDAALALEDALFLKAAGETFQRIVGEQPSGYVDSPEFKKLFLDLTHGIVVSAIDQSVSSRVRSLLVNLARTAGLVLTLARSADNESYSRSTYFEQRILLPAGIFPLPTTKQDFSKQRKADEERRKKKSEDRKKLVELASELTANRTAIDELLTTYEKTSFTPGRSVSVTRPSSGGATRPGGFVLPETEIAKLQPATRTVLKTAGLEGAVDVARAASLIEKRSHEISAKLYRNRSASRYLVNIGTGFVPSNTVVLDDLTLDDSAFGTGEPGPCPPVPASPASESVTVPLWTTHGEARALGFADLMLVEQDLLRYQLGEIAHIENVLIGELREREFRTATTTEVSTTTETETTDEKTKDLTSAERFELQTETERVINENTSTQAGVTVNASYGPTVDVSANFNYTDNTAKESSNRASTNFARETTEKATSKIQKRTLERRLTRTVSEIEEKNKHSFENREADAENISGVYRFVDKIYRAQVVTYGKRFMLEFVVPEPAAFLRYAITRQPAEGIRQTKPDEPGYCRNGVFAALQPQDITPETYLFWASKYLAEDITPPPSTTQIVAGGAINEAGGAKSQITQDIYDAVEIKELKIPAGYKPTKAIVTVEGWNVADSSGAYPAHLSVQIQKELVVGIQNSAVIDVNLESDVTDRIPISIVAKNYEKYAVVANVFCVLTKEKYEEWQLKTYVSIVNAYNELKTRYDNALETMRIKASFTQISGTNPLANREREKTELKKGCISLLTGQAFEEFDSMRRDVAPHGYPEIAFADAEAEGRYIQFFENAFEWVNMTYVFYPYFWGTKDDWVTISQIADVDPLYERFLQAGAARVQVPVRPGFEISLTNFLGIRSLWFGEGTLLTAEDEHQAENLYLSVLDELKEQLGNQLVEGQGRLAVEKNDEVVNGTGTRFTQDDEQKRIIIKGVTYLIKQVVSASEIRVTPKYAGNDESGVRYSMGAKLVGEPWEVKLPTELVMIAPNGQTLIVP